MASLKELVEMKMNVNLWLRQTKNSYESFIFIVFPQEKEIRFCRKGKKEKTSKEDI